MVNDTTRLLGLDGLVVTVVEDGHDGRPVVHLDTGDQRARSCPGCGVTARRVKGWVTIQPRDLAVAGRQVDLRWRKRRWLCDQQGCERQTFTEAVGEVSARARVTGRLRRAAGAAVADGGRTIVQSARDHGLSWPVVSAAFTEHAGVVLPGNPEPVAVLGIDEIRRDRPQWTWNEQHQCWEVTVDRWHVGFVDLAGGQGLLGQVEGRTAAAVRHWINQRDDTWRQSVRFVAIDMCTISMLYGAAWRAARGMGYRRLITYTQHGETGASLRAAGLRPVATLRARDGWDSPRRTRISRGVDNVERVRWQIESATAGRYAA
jgi:transposase